MKRPDLGHALLAFLCLFALGLAGLVVATDPSPPPAPKAPVTILTNPPTSLFATDLHVTTQGFLVLKTPAGRWGLLSPTGGLLVWFNSPEVTQQLERQLRHGSMPQMFKKQQ